MADQAVGELIRAQSIGATDLFVLEQGGVSKSLTGQILLNWLTAAADGHGGIHSVQKVSTSGLVDTYRITLADTTFIDIPVTNGRGITGISKTGTSGLVDTHTIKYNDGTTSTFTVTNGKKGDKGDNAYTWIKYASQEPTESSHSMGDIPDDWRGEYNGPLSSPPTDWKQYKWYKIKGDKGDTGAPAALISSEVTYQVSDSGTIIPSGEWTASVPVVAQGKYLWTRTIQQYNTGSPITAYSVSRMGMDGLGSVSSVCNVSPDADGNVELSASDVGALPTTGGDLTGELRMNGQPISGLNEPTEGTQAAPKSYVDKRVPLDGSQAMGGNLSMGGNRVTGLAEPEDDGDAATKGYTDTKASLPKTASGTVIALSDASDGPLQGLRIYGRTTQDGTPTPDAPVELVSVGDGGSVGVTVASKNIVTSIRNGSFQDAYYNSLFAKVDILLPDTDYFISFVGASGHKCYTNESIFPHPAFTCTGRRQGMLLHTLKNISKDKEECYNPQYGWILFKNDVGNTVVPSFSDVQIEFATAMTDYEAPVPYQSLPISTPNGLPGIPVTSGGNYTDADGQQWVCDEVDFARGVYVQRIYTGIARKAIRLNHFQSNGIFQAEVSIGENVLDGYGLNSHFKMHNVSGADAAGGTFIILNKILYLRSTILDTLEKWNAFLAENTVEYSAALGTPIETPILEGALAAYAALHTNKPNTTIYSDAGAHMDVGYYPPDATMRQEDIKGYVDSKLKFGGVSMANSVVMEYSLGTSFTDEQSADIRSGKFEKVHVGGYWTINGRKYWAAHADYRLHCGDTELTTHHMLVIPDRSFYNGVMNNDYYTTGAYYGSKMKTSGLANALATVKADFGADHILTHRIILANAVSNGVSSGWAWCDSQIDLMNEHMVYGSYAWGGGSKNGYDTGSDKSQLALFQARPDLITIRENWWLRDVRSATLFCGVNSEGYASGWDASDSLGVRPAFLIY